MFCDWLNVWQQFDGSEYPDYLGGRVISIEGACGLERAAVADAETGEMIEQWTVSGSDDIGFNTAKFAAHRGSYETNIMIRFVAGRLEVRGNPSSYGRLDNLFGLQLDACIDVYNGVLAQLGLPQFTDGEVQRIWLENEERWSTVYTGAHVTRVDMTQNLAVGMGRVRDFHKWLAQQKFSRSSPGDDDLEKFARWNYESVYTSNSKYWINSKFYDKSAAIEQRTLPEYLKRLKAASREGRMTRGDVQALYEEAEQYLNRLACWCAEHGVTRGEWSFRSRWFAQNEGIGFWKPGQTESEILKFAGAEMEKINLRACVHNELEFESLTDREYRTLQRWKQGENLKEIYSNSAFYRFRSAILKKTGHDIAARPLQTSLPEFRPVYFRVQPLSLSDAPVWYRRPSESVRLVA